MAARRSHSKTRAALLTDEELVKALRVSDGAVLVGGQALAFWVGYFNLSVRLGPRAYISRDGDFLGRREHVKRFAAAVGGRAEMASRRGLWALHGAVTRPGHDGPVVLIDVLSSVVGIDSDDVRKHAIRATFPGDRSLTFDVMNPLDCMVSRFENLRQIADKQNEIGVWQAQISIDICRAFTHWQLANAHERAAIRIATRVLQLAGAAAGLQAYRRYDLEPLDAIPVDEFKASTFRAQQYERTVSRIFKLRANYQEPPKPRG
jgi:hypothetical protein